MKIRTLKGRVSIGTGAGNATKNLTTAKDVLLKKGIDISVFHPGTINIKLDEEFFCDKCYALCVTQAELVQFPEVAKQNKPDEIWRFITVLAVNDEPRDGFVYRTNHPRHSDDYSLRYGCHGPGLIELITKTITINHNDLIKVVILESH